MSLQKGHGGGQASNHQVCSIEYLHNQSPWQEMLLQSDAPNAAVPQEDDDQNFQLYISPYTDNGFKSYKKQGQKAQQDITILLCSKKEQGSTQLYRADEEQEIIRLQKIIQNKNRVIGQLTEELRTLNEELVGLSKPGRDKGLELSREASSSFKKGREVGKEGNNKINNKEIQFLQRNNRELYEQLCKCRVELDQCRKEVEKLNNRIVPKLQLKVNRLQTENKELMRSNGLLMKEVKQYIKQGQKEIQYVNKMRNILAEKTDMKELNFQMSLSATKIYDSGKANILYEGVRTSKEKQKKQRKQKKQKRKPLSKEDSDYKVWKKQKRGHSLKEDLESWILRDRCFSIDRLHRNCR